MSSLNGNVQMHKVYRNNQDFRKRIKARVLKQKRKKKGTQHIQIELPVKCKGQLLKGCNSLLSTRLELALTAYGPTVLEFTVNLRVH